MIDVKLKTEKAKTYFKKLMDKCENMTPIFEKFKNEYREIVAQNFEAKGKIMEGERWVEYSKKNYRAMTKRELKKTSLQIGQDVTSGRTAYSKYLKWKKKHYGNAPMGVLTGKMKKATIGFSVNINNKKCLFYIDGEDYYYYFQEREKFGRKTLYTKNKDLPMVAWRLLIQMTNDEIKSVKDG